MRALKEMARVSSIESVSLGKGAVYLPSSRTRSGSNGVDSKTGKVIKSDKNELVRCVTCVRVPGKVSCARCNGKGELLYRSAEWR